MPKQVIMASKSTFLSAFFKFVISDTLKKQPDVDV